LPWQQPVEHDVASHTHEPEAQRWPDSHAAPVPHAHEPSAAHRSERASHAMQPTPPVPHALAVVGRTHVAPEQQPSAHVLALQLAHTPLMQPSPPGQVAHSAPPVPHALDALPGWQVVPVQQPLHDSASQTHAPETQCCPAPHAAPVPQ